MNIAKIKFDIVKQSYLKSFCFVSSSILSIYSANINSSISSYTNFLPIVCSYKELDIVPKDKTLYIGINYTKGYQYYICTVKKKLENYLYISMKDIKRNTFANKLSLFIDTMNIEYIAVEGHSKFKQYKVVEGFKYFVMTETMSIINVLVQSEIQRLNDTESIIDNKITMSRKELRNSLQRKNIELIKAFY